MAHSASSSKKVNEKYYPGWYFQEHESAAAALLSLGYDHETALITIERSWRQSSRTISVYTLDDDDHIGHFVIEPNPAGRVYLWNVGNSCYPSPEEALRQAQLEGDPSEVGDVQSCVFRWDGIGPTFTRVTE